MPSKLDNHFSYEEEFHSQDRKQARKERKRARTKDRSHLKKTDQDKIQEKKISEEGALIGRVLAISTGSIVVSCEDVLYPCTLRGTLKQLKGQAKNLIAPGDFVHFLPEEKVVFQVEERQSVLSRAEHLEQKREQVIAANIDQVIITCSVVSPPLKPFLVDRYIIAAHKGNMRPLIVVNKIDLLKEGSEERALFLQFVETYQKLGLSVVKTSLKTQEGIDELKMHMRGNASVFSGQSGVGKSSLINAVLGTNLPTRDIVLRTKKGAHTTTSAEFLPLEGGGFCIDTPGIRSFGIWKLSKEDLASYFHEIAEKSSRCRFRGCRHLQEPGCAVKEAVDKKEISPLRFQSYLALIEALDQEHQRR